MIRAPGHPQPPPGAGGFAAMDSNPKTEVNRRGQSEFESNPQSARFAERRYA